MHSLTAQRAVRTHKVVTVIAVIAAVILGVMATNKTALAAPPYSVKYNGTATTSAVPGKPFTLNLKVTNTGTTVYSGVKVIVHVPDGVTHSKIAPANASPIDDLITWSNVPIAAGKSFYPSITMTLDTGTPLKTKKNIWVEVTGEGMEANSQNFSVTAVKTVTATTSTTTVSATEVTSLFKLVYGRTPTTSESTYWMGRRTDKPSRGALIGAMQFHKLNGIAH